MNEHKTMKWISVNSRLPEVGEHVLVSNGGFVCESFLDERQNWQRGGTRLFFMTPTHWMPLPEPPKRAILTSSDEPEREDDNG